METISLIASIVAIILAFFAIWQANEHKKESDKLNKDTTEKLAKIETFAETTMEAAFGELSKWGEYARQDGRMGRGEEKEMLDRLKQELLEATREDIDQKIAILERKIGESLTHLRTGGGLEVAISEIKKEFQTLNQEMLRIQLRNVTQAINLDKRIRLERLKKQLPSKQKKVLKAIIDNPKMRGDDLIAMGYGLGSVLVALSRLLDSGLVNWVDDKWVFDEDIKEILK